MSYPLVSALLLQDMAKDPPRKGETIHFSLYLIYQSERGCGCDCGRVLRFVLLSGRRRSFCSFIPTGHWQNPEYYLFHPCIVRTWLLSPLVTIIHCNRVFDYNWLSLTFLFNHLYHLLITTASYRLEMSVLLVFWNSNFLCLRCV